MVFKASGEILKIIYGGTQIASSSNTTVSGSNIYIMRAQMRNAGVANVQASAVQIASNGSGADLQTTAPVNTTINSASSQTVGVSTDNLSAYGWTVFVTYSVVVKPF